MDDLTKGDIAEAAVRVAKRAVEAIAAGTSQPIYAGSSPLCARRLAARDVLRQLDEVLDVLAELPNPTEELERMTARAKRAEAIVHDMLREAEPGQDVREVFAASAGWAYQPDDAAWNAERKRQYATALADGYSYRDVVDEDRPVDERAMGYDPGVDMGAQWTILRPFGYYPDERPSPIVLDVSDRCPPNYRTPTEIRALCAYAGEPSPGATIPAPTGRIEP